MATKKAFLKYLGNRKWRKVRRSKTPSRKNYLKYVGNRSWKKVSTDPSLYKKTTN
jgi:hypothetical protein